ASRHATHIGDHGVRVAARRCRMVRPASTGAATTVHNGRQEGSTSDPLPIRRGVMGSTSDFGSDGSGSSPGGGASLRVSSPDSPPRRRPPGVSGMSDALLLAEAKRRGHALMIADLLRSAAMARLATRGRCATSEPLLDELLAHTRRNGMPIQRAGAHALQARRLILAGKQDAALTEIARALAILDDPPDEESHGDARASERALVRALIDCWQVLSELSLYET